VVRVVKDQEYEAWKKKQVAANPGNSFASAAAAAR
jgi:hypothetical protein